MAIEPKRGCGYRKVGGLYLCGGGSGVACDRLPFLLDVCPTCHAGIKQSRGWTWIDVAGLTGGDHPHCQDDFPCPFCMGTSEMGKAGLLWIGERFYATPRHFTAEADALRISRRIAAIPRNFKVGETWVLLAHPKAVNGDKPGIFRVFRPSRIEEIITQTQSKDPAFMAELAKQNLTPVVVPDSDRDHQGTVYDESEGEPELPLDSVSGESADE